MTEQRMGAKRYLQQIGRLDSRIAALIAQRDDLMVKRTAIRGIRYDEEKVQTSPSGEVPANRATEKIVDIARQIDERMDDYNGIRTKITEQIHEMPDQRHSIILQKRYVERLPFYLIADEMGYTYETVRHYHLDALKAFAEMYAHDIEAYGREKAKQFTK